MRSIQLELELILDLTVSGTAWQGIDLEVTVATLTIEIVSISQSAVRGSPLAAVMIHVWIAASTRDYSY
jgi:hypothetical protein